MLESSFDKVAEIHPENLFKTRLQHRCFTVNFTEFLRTPFLQSISRRLLLEMSWKIKLTHYIGDSHQTQFHLKNTLKTL